MREGAAGDRAAADRFGKRALAHSASAARPHPVGLVNTTSGIHVAQSFNFNIPAPKIEVHRVNLVWGSRWPTTPKGVYNAFYVPYDRADLQHPLAWFVANHPDWIEYQCDQHTPAYEYNDSNVPLDITNPAVVAFQRSTEVLPALHRGYRGIAFDNLSLRNGIPGYTDRRCGHYSPQGTWIDQYSRDLGDVHFRHDVIVWTKHMSAYIHHARAHATMWINYSYNYTASEKENLELMDSVDLVSDERGFTQNAKGIPTPSQWQAIVTGIARTQRHGVCYIENNIEPGPTSTITPAERAWAVGNYLLTKGACTFISMVGSLQPRGIATYGEIAQYPEYRLPVGAPAGPARLHGQVWARNFTGALVLVNPSEADATYAVRGKSLRDLSGRPVSGPVTLARSSALILLKQRR